MLNGENANIERDTTRLYYIYVYTHAQSEREREKEQKGR